MKSGKQELKVTFKTLTPLWTGDAWGKCNVIRPSSIVGSLRFWFEVIAYFAGITTDTDYEGGKLKGNIKSDQFKKRFLELQSKYPEKNYNELVDMTLASYGIPLPARVFGCTGWRGMIKIKDIKPIEDYRFGNRLNLPSKICVSKKDGTIRENKYCPKLSNRDYSVWYFSQPYFYGKFDIIFEVEQNLVDTIFYPLLNFIEEYGFLGGKWNIGYGRVKVLKVNEERINLKNYREFKFSKFYKYEEEKYTEIGQDKDINNVIKNKSDFNKLKERDKSILVLENQVNNKNLKETIKKLIKLKAKQRKGVSNNSERHSVFGSTHGEAQGTKIIPWIYEENGEFKGGFISIAGILKLVGGKNGER